jgi:hypothetical protein
VRSDVGRDDGPVLRKSPVVREDVDAILAVLFDIKRELIRIRQALEEGDDGEEPEED